MWDKERLFPATQSPGTHPDPEIAFPILKQHRHEVVGQTLTSAPVLDGFAVHAVETIAPRRNPDGSSALAVNSHHQARHSRHSFRATVSRLRHAKQPLRR